MNKFRLFIKRSFDIIASLGGLIVLSPIMIICAILIRINLGSPIIFKQKRIGKDNKEFEMIKFRSMTDERDENGQLLPNELRLTKFGKILRSLSIDELPELINILKGEMSLIGPRPLPTRYLPLYNENQIKRHNVLPGLTGLAQVKGRNSLTWSERFNLDVWYVENWSIWLDVKIFFLTFYKVFKRDGINQSNTSIMEAFNGYN
ncbi:sugar transferase [Clostridium perfringens]|nr:UDP-galactose phosphate transferase [Clostridium novyi]